MAELIQTLHDELQGQVAQGAASNPREIKLNELPDKISVAIGMRRTGKTTLLLQKLAALIESGISLEQILYVDFEDDRLLPMDGQGLAELLDSFYALYPENHSRPCFLFLDEIQNVDNWALVIRRFYNTKDVRIYLSGSSAKLLSKEIATSLRGRSVTTEVWPYSFREYLTVTGYPQTPLKASKQHEDQLRHALMTYLKIGGFPGMQNLDNTLRTQQLREYVDIVTFRDLIERHQLSNPSLIRYMVLYLLRNAATNFSVNKFYNDLKSLGYKATKAHLYDYLEHIEDAYLSFTVPLYAESIRKVNANPKKIYTIDPGIHHTVSVQGLDSLGRLFEGLIYLDLRRRGDEITYYKTQKGFEVDFFTRRLDGQQRLYQVALSLDDLNVLQREQRALQAAEEELGVQGEIITLESYLNGKTDLNLGLSSS